jgi:hypothetical protein
VGLGSEIEAGGRPSTILFVIDCTADIPERMAFQKSCIADDGLEDGSSAIFPIEMQRGDNPDTGGVQECGVLKPAVMPRRFQLVGIAGAGYQSQADGEENGSAGLGTQGQRQAHPILGEDIWSLGIVSQDHSIALTISTISSWEGLQEPSYLGNDQRLGAQGLALQEFAIGGPVAAEGDAAEGAGDPAFGRDQAAAEKFEDTAPRARQHGRQKVGNPL